MRETIHDLIFTKRLHFVRNKHVEYDALVHLAKVMQYAMEHNCSESLLNAFNRLAPAADADAVIVVFAEDPLNFFWARFPRIEYDTITHGDPPFPEFNTRGKYHGGLIGHVVYKDGEATMQRDWSVHT